MPGYNARVAAFARATNTLNIFRERVARQTSGPEGIRVAFAPTNRTMAPLDQLSLAWSGPKPLRAKHLSPFWDTNDESVLTAIRQFLSGRPADKRSQRVAVVLGPRGQTDFSSHLAKGVDSVHRLKALDSETRVLHAKCLLIESDEWVAALVGSSNHTKAGLGLAKFPRHREMNVWLGARIKSKEGRALLDLIELGEKVASDVQVVDPKDEDETVLPALPACFELCQVTRSAQERSWELHLGIAETQDMLCDWKIAFAADTAPFITRAEWVGRDKQKPVVINLPPQLMPMFVVVEWEGNTAPWAVLADNPHVLPVGVALSSLQAHQLLDALAAGRSLAQVLREQMERELAMPGTKSVIVLDPLKRLEVEGSLLRKGRALAASLEAMQRRFERPVVTLDTLRGRLASPLGPEFVAMKVVEAVEAGKQLRAEAIFTIAEIALVLGRVNWSLVLAQVDRAQGNQLVDEVLVRLDVLRARVGSQTADLASYASRAITEARKCVVC